MGQSMSKGGEMGNTYHQDFGKVYLTFFQSNPNESQLFYNFQKRYSSPPYPWGMCSNLQWVPETANGTEPYIYGVFSYI